MSGKTLQALAADFVFDGDTLHRDAAIVIDRADIKQVLPRASLDSSVTVQALPPGVWLAPGFVDLQVNGGGDVLFNATPTADGIERIVAAHRQFGTTSLLPTLITDSDASMQAARDAVQAAMAREPGVLGIHFEGPFLSPQKPGVHSRAHIRKPQPHHHEMLAGLRGGVTLVTLAPEETQDSCAPASKSRSAIPWPLTRRRAPQWRKGSTASRTCSTPCGRWTAASRDRSPPRWNRPRPGTG
jgi:N-acetylglucosamine-6-phosphate deacetylase